VAYSPLRICTSKQTASASTIRIAGREACVGDDAKRRATNLRGSSGLSEVGVIEYVKDFPAKLDHLVFLDLRAV
jgi:hypothetical protein